MKFVGDEAGIAVLHSMKDSNKDYLKFLIQEARTVFENRVDFKDKEGTAYRLTFLPKEQNFVVSKL
jgi:hypothetical protein